jgi:hypothetical protein
MKMIGKGRGGNPLRAMREGTGIRTTRNTQGADILRVPAPIAGRADAGHLPQKEIAATADADLTTIDIIKEKKEDPAQELTIEEQLRGIRRRPRNARWPLSLIRDLRILSRGLSRVRPKLKKVPCFLAVSTSLLSSFVR